METPTQISIMGVASMHSLAQVYPTWGVDIGAMSAVYRVEVQRRGGALAHDMLCGSRLEKKIFVQN